MSTMNLGVRYRHTFQRGAFTPFAFIAEPDVVGGAPGVRVGYRF